MMEGKIIRNSIRTPDGTELVSTHRHDFVAYTDANGQYYAVDGGTDYLKRSCDVKDYTETSVMNNDDFEKIRDAFKWGTYGKNGDQPMKRVKLKDLEDDHIQAIIDTQKHLAHSTIVMFRNEQEYRKANHDS